MSQITPVDAVRLLLNPNIDKKLVVSMFLQQFKKKEIGPILSKLLGSGIVGISSIIRIPQIRKIVNPEKLSQRVSVSKGLSLSGISLETLGYLIHVVYNHQNKNPFVNYGETLLVGLQNVAIIILIKYYHSRENGSVLLAVIDTIRPILVMLAISIGIGKFASHDFISTLQVLNIPISILSKLPQIRQNYLLQSTGHLSNITVGANVLGSFTRVFTTLQDFEKLGRDKVLLVGYGSLFFLNAVLAGQCYYYGNNTIGTDEKKNN